MKRLTLFAVAALLAALNLAPIYGLPAPLPSKQPAPQTKHACQKAGMLWKSGIKETGYPVGVCVAKGSDINTVEVIAYAKFMTTKFAKK